MNFMKIFSKKKQWTEFSELLSVADQKDANQYCILYYLEHLLELPTYLLW